MKRMPPASVVFFAILTNHWCAEAYAVESGTLYPTKPIRIIVPFAPSGGSDLVARMLAQKLYQALGYPIIVDNRAGGGGTMGTATAAKATPDGYTVLWGTLSGLVINPLLSSKLPYDSDRDFAPVSMVSINPYLLVVNNALPVKSLKELVSLAKAKPGQLNYSSPGYGSPAHLAMELFKIMTGAEIVHIAYKGAGPALIDLMAGHVQVKFQGIAAGLPLVRAGKIKALAISTAHRSRVVPDLATVIELGVPGFDVVSWYALFVPAKTPKHIIDKLNTQVVQILADRDVVQRVNNDGGEPRGSTPEELATYMRDEAERWKKVIKEAPPS